MVRAKTKVAAVAEASKQQLHCNKVCTFPGLKRKERREKREEITKKAARDPQID